MSEPTADRAPSTQPNGALRFPLATAGQVRREVAQRFAQRLGGGQV